MNEVKEFIARTRVYLGEGELKAIKRVIDSGIFVKGPEVKKFEEEFAQYCGVSNGIAVNSGTTALFLSLLIVGLKPNEEVITVPNTFVATANAIIHAGGVPKFVDVDPNTMNMNVSNIKKEINPKTKVIIPVHLYGLPVDMDPIRELAEDNDLILIEDACQAHGAEYKGKMTGSLGYMAAFSFYPTKNLTVGGDGGMILTDDEEKAEELRMLRDHGRRSTYDYQYIGYNFRLSEILGAIGRFRLKELNNNIRKRLQLAKKYAEYLSDHSQINLPVNPPYAKHVYYLYVPKFKNRDRLRDFLKKRGIETAIDYPNTINQMKPYKELFGYSQGMFPIAEKLTKEILALPIYPELESSKIEHVSSVIRNFYKE